MAAVRHVHAVPGIPTAVSGAVGRAGWLEDWRLAAAVLALATVVVAAWTVFAVRARRSGRRPRHAVVRRLGLGILVALLVLTGAGLGVNSYAGYAPDVTALRQQVPSLIGVRGVGGGPVGTSTMAGSGRYGPRLLEVLLGDQADRIPRGRTWILLPAGYSDPANAGRRYPVVYLIHGYPSASFDWFGAGRAGLTETLLQQRRLIQPMILVAPDASAGTLHDTECLDSSTGGPRLETFLTRTVVSYVDSRFRTVRSRSGRAVGGVSAGGFCALNLGLRHQDEYAAILGMMPYGDPGRNAVNYMLGGDAALGAANSPSDYVATMPIFGSQHVFLGSARNDREAGMTARRLAGELAARGVYVGLSIATDDGHTWKEGRAELPYALRFASDALTASGAGAIGVIGAVGAMRVDRQPRHPVVGVPAAGRTTQTRR